MITLMTKITTNDLAFRLLLTVYPSSSNVPFVRGRDIRNVVSQGPSGSRQLRIMEAGVQRQELQHKTEDPSGNLLALCFFMPHMGSLDHNHAS
jgi:hypothetical protein